MLNDILLILIASATSTLTAITGVGGGMMLIAIMPGFLPPAAIVPVHATVQLFSNSSRALFGWQFLRWEFVLGFVAGAIAGGLFAAGITREINLEYSPLFIAAYILFSIWGPGIRLRLPPAGEFIVIGALQTGLSMIVGATGPMSFTHLIKIVLFALLGFSFLAYWKIILGMSLGVIAGAWMGTRIRYRIPEDPFRKILRWLLTLLALRMIYITLF
jgi:uncharacterized membrane protein YfcA